VENLEARVYKKENPYSRGRDKKIEVQGQLASISK
jgi:hypothetical protein